MTKIAGFDIDEIIRDDEETRALDKAAAEKARRRKELEEKRRRLRKDKSKDIPPAMRDDGSTQEEPVQSGVISLNNLMWENPAYRKPRETNKVLLCYNNSLDRLRVAGYERHGRPAEVFGLLCDGLEGKLNPAEKAIYDDMLRSYGEWLNAAFERKGDLLVVYFDPVGLEWDNSANKYVVQGRLSYTQRKEYDITGKISENYIDLNKFSSDFVQDMYSRPFDTLPEEMREGANRSQVYLPQEGNIWPVGRGIFYVGFNVYYLGIRASRGVSLVGQKVP